MQVDALNPNIVWSASEDGTLRQHDFRQGTPCSSSSSSNCTCQNILVSHFIPFQFVYNYNHETIIAYILVECTWMLDDSLSADATEGVAHFQDLTALARTVQPCLFIP